MMSQGTLDVWIGDATRLKRPWGGWLLGLLAGALLGSAVTGLAVDRLHEARAEQTSASGLREWPHPALDRQWRGLATPVQVERMFRSRR